VRWIIDTSAWSRRHDPAVAKQLEEMLAEEDDELVLSPAVQLELLREPQGGAVAKLRTDLEEAMDVLEADAETFALAADAMEVLARHHAHRLPVTDLITAALAHQHECGIVHRDGDYQVIADHSDLGFEVIRVEPDDGGSGGPASHPAKRQRQLKREMASLVHQMPIAEAEAFLHEVVEKARERVEDATA